MRGCIEGFIAAIILLEGSGLVALACMRAPGAGHSGREIIYLYCSSTSEYLYTYIDLNIYWE
jgi:hypothetical protein